VNTTQHNFGDIDVNTQSRDTTVYIYNYGTGSDSVSISINYYSLSPAASASVFPRKPRISSGDSAAITFTFYPPLINRSGLGIYQPGLRVVPKNGVQLEKKIPFPFSWNNRC